MVGGYFLAPTVTPDLSVVTLTLAHVETPTYGMMTLFDSMKLYFTLGDSLWWVSGTSFQW
jgi:hypothetical protein